MSFFCYSIQERSTYRFRSSFRIFAV
jgi:hypothetical protein